MNTGLKNLHLRRDSPSLRRFFSRKVKNRRRPALETYKYDASGNILEKVINGQKTNYSYDKGNQLASSTVNGLKTDYNYDAAGRMSSETTAGVTKSYTYGWLDKVTKVQTGDSVTTFSYYADGQLAQKKSGETVENFYWDELALLRRGDTNYLNDPAVTGGNPILADNTILFTDMLGNTLGSVENEVFQPIGRTAFGENTSKQSASLDFFTGKPQVDGLGYNFLLRNYNAKAGKWQTQDPISLASTMPSANAPILETFGEKLGYPDGWNNLAYCNSDAMNAVDAFGGKKVYYKTVTVTKYYQLTNYGLNFVIFPAGTSNDTIYKWCIDNMPNISADKTLSEPSKYIPTNARYLAQSYIISTYVIYDEVRETEAGRAVYAIEITWVYTIKYEE